MNSSDAPLNGGQYSDDVLLAFLAFVVLLAGFVAYAADNIARRAGRRHLRLFGLRPKTTALIVAVLAGMGISLTSMLAFFALNRQAIRNIEQADQLRVQLNGLKKDVVAVQGDLKNARAERDNANMRAEQARLASQQATAQLGQAQQALETAKEATGRLTAQTSQLRVQTGQLKTQAQGLQTRVSRLNALRTELEAQALQNQKRLSTSQAELTRAQSRASGLDARLSTVQRQITLLDRQNALAQAQAKRAQTEAAQAQGRVNDLQGQLAQLDAARLDVTRQRDQAASQLGQVQAQLGQTQGQVRQAQAQIELTRTQAQQAKARASQALSQLTSLTAQRDAVRQNLTSLQKTVAGLQAQSLALKNDNDTLRLSLSSSQADVKHLEDEYSRATSELSASRNTELSYSKNSIVYGGVVASVRSLDSFLESASTAATARGARGTPAARLAPVSRQVLEATLRGLNASTFVLCRASGNAAAGFAVDLSCDARPNVLLYTHGSVIRQATINLKGSDEALRGQLQDLIGDAVLDLTRRGVPVENVLNGGLNTASLYSLLTRLAERGGNTAVVGVMPRSDVKPSSQVDLYADIVQ